MKKIIVSLLLVTVLVIPASASASSLSSQQISAILGLLQAFGASQSVIDNVQRALGGNTNTTQLTPVISLISPTSGPIGTMVTLYGSGFNATGDNIINVSDGQSGVTLKAKTVYGNSLSFIIPSTFITGRTYKISVDNDLVSNIVYFTVSGAFSSTSLSGTTTPAIVVTSPNSGVSHQVGSVLQINYSTANLGDLNVNIDLVDQYSSIKNIARNVSNSGVYTWIPTTDLVGTQGRIRVSSVNYSAVGFSTYFTITSSNATATSSLTAYIANASKQAVTSVALVDNAPNVSVSNAIFWGFFSGGTYPYKCYWDLGDASVDYSSGYQCISPTAIGAKYRAGKYNVKFKVVDANGVTVEAQPVQATVTVNATATPLAQPSITVLSPNGGEQWVQKSTHIMAWNVSNYSYRENITKFGFELLDSQNNSVITKQIILGQGTSNSYQFVFPENLQNGYYKIRVSLCREGAGAETCLATNATNLPYSISNSFTIISSAPAPTVDLKIEGSDGPRTIQSGAYITPSWTSTNANYCTTSWNNGSTVNQGIVNYGTTITTPITTSGTYTVTCSSPDGRSASDSVTVNVTAPAQANTPADVLTTSRSITVTGPLNSYYAPNSTYISFTSSGVSRVKIEACVNKTSCTMLASSVSVTSSNTNWFWNIPNDQPFVGAFGEKQVWLKVTDLDSSTSAFAPSYIYIIGQATSTSSPSPSPTSSRLDKDALFGAVLKAFNFLNQ